MCEWFTSVCEAVVHSSENQVKFGASVAKWKVSSIRAEIYIMFGFKISHSDTA